MSNGPAPLILASESPRRLALLGQIGVTPDRVSPAALDESPRAGETPPHYAARLALEKALAEAVAGEVTLAADTVVACGRRILPKAETQELARSCLRLLSGRAHLVYTAVSVVDARGAVRSRLVTTRVSIKRLSDADISGYLASEEWRGKAGGYAIQGAAGRFVTRINGSYSAVVGLPLYETAGLLAASGVAIG